MELIFKIRMSTLPVLIEAFKYISFDLDNESVGVVHKAMLKKKIDIIKLEDMYYFKEGSVLVEFNELNKELNGNRSFTRKMCSIVDLVNTLKNIQNGDLDSSDNGIDISAYICKSLTIRYLYEKVKMLEKEINLLKSN